MLSCPSCGGHIRRKDYHPEGFFCPGCKERLRLQELCRYERPLAVLAGSLLAFLAPWLLGAQGLRLFVLGFVLLVPMGCALGALRALLFPFRLITDCASPGHISEPVGNVLRITGPPDSRG